MEHKCGRFTIRVEDLDASVAWYTERLGFRLAGRYGERFAEVVTPGLTVLLHQSVAGQPTRLPAGAVSLGLQVDDVDDARAELEARGVVFEGDTVDVEGLRIAFTSDPDGIPVYILETSAFN